MVTLYEFEPAAGIKSSRIISLADDIARSMRAISARVAVVPGRNVIGIELPNAKREMVYLREIVQAQEFVESKAKLGLAFRQDNRGRCYCGFSKKCRIFWWLGQQDRESLLLLIQ